jgi:hypothetical protein
MKAGLSLTSDILACRVCEDGVVAWHGTFIRRSESD